MYSSYTPNETYVCQGPRYKIKKYVVLNPAHTVQVCSGRETQSRGQLAIVTNKGSLDSAIKQNLHKKRKNPVTLQVCNSTLSLSLFCILSRDQIFISQNSQSLSLSILCAVVNNPIGKPLLVPSYVLGIISYMFDSTIVVNPCSNCICQGFGFHWSSADNHVYRFYELASSLYSFVKVAPFLDLPVCYGK